MRRVHLFELEDQPWFPERFRDLITDSLQLGMIGGGFYDPVVPLLVRLAAAGGALVDLCSGGTGPLLALRRAPALARVPITFTDRYPNQAAPHRVEALRDPRLRYHADAVDATTVPGELSGARTMFTAFHHFRPTAARQVLADAAARRVPIGIFEMTERTLASCLASLTSSGPRVSVDRDPG